MRTINTQTYSLTSLRYVIFSASYLERKSQAQLEKQVE